MIILFRSCETNLSPGSLGDGTANKPRWGGKFKLEIIRKCYKSLQNGLDESDKIVIINDNTSQETLTWMRNNTKAQFSILDITPLATLRKNHPFPSYHPVLPASCTELMDYLVEICQNNQNEIIYVCEDDYLHTSTAIELIKAFFNSNNFNGFFIPYDYPDRYTIDSSRVCELFYTNIGHVRTVPSATLTMAAKGSTWLQYKFDILRSGAFADDSWTWKAFAQLKAVCPIPGIATHLQDNCITPRIDWVSVYNEILL